MSFVLAFPRFRMKKSDLVCKNSKLPHFLSFHPTTVPRSCCRIKNSETLLEKP